MSQHLWRWLLLLILAVGLFLVGCDSKQRDPFPELSWDDLMPPDWDPNDQFDGFEEAEELADEDPRAQELFRELQHILDDAPVVDALDGKAVRLPGFVLPLAEHGEGGVTEFLLVPYFGACVHVPPPPANQIIHVVAPEDAPWPGGLFDSVWVRGILQVTPFQTHLGRAGYRIKDAQITRYEETD